MSRLIACVGLFALVACATATKFRDCGSVTGQVTSVQVSGCPDSADTCILKRGSNMDISIVFGSKSDTATVETVIHGIVKGVPLPFSAPEPDGCKTGLTCPLKNGQSYTYTNTIAVRKIYPPMYVTVRWELQDDQEQDLVCVEIDGELQ